MALLTTAHLPASMVHPAIAAEVRAKAAAKAASPKVATAPGT